MQINDIINNYKILEFIKEKRDGNYYYNLRVECLICGSQRKIPKRNLFFKSRCGIGPCHQKFINIKDKRFGSVIAKEFVKCNSSWKWKCECDCGESWLIDSKQLRIGGQTSCKKCSSIESSKRKTLPDNLSAKNRLFRQYRRGAISRGYSFDITFLDMMSIVSNNCYYCGNEPYEYSNGLIRNGIDRIDNSIGYTVDNCIPCCSQCNTSKMDYTIKDFYNWIQKIYINLHKKGMFNDYPERE